MIEAYLLKYRIAQIAHTVPVMLMKAYVKEVLNVS